MKNISKIHDGVFTELQKWSERSRGVDEINPYFYMRSSKDERFERGYWFPGNDSYLCISFWAGGDSLNKTPNVYFEINEKLGCRVIMSAKDSQNKLDYFIRLIGQLNLSQSSNKYSINKKGGTCSKLLSKDFKNYLNELNDFIAKDKRIIDEFIKNNPPEEEEFITRFTFIDSKIFDVTYSAVLKQRELLLMKEREEAQEFIQKPKLPIALLKFTVENYQGIKYTSIEGIPPDARWIFITGENGYGKTTVLQSIALGLNANPDLEKYISSEKTRIQIELTHNNEKAYPIRTKGGISQIDGIDFGEYLVGFGPARLNVQPRATENSSAKGNQSVASLFDNTHTLKNINYELFASNKSEQELFEELENMIREVTNDRITKVEVVNREVLFVERLSDGDELDPIPLENLAAGFRSIINTVFDIYLRLRSVHKTTFKAAELYGIVLIDEIENHLHPILQRELPETLSKVFPKIQFIASTHSPIPLLGAPKNSVILKVSRNKESGVTVERLDDKIDFPNLLPNTILTSPIFGFEGIIANANSNIEDIETAPTFEKAEALKKLRTTLKILKSVEKDVL